MKDFDYLDSNEVYLDAACQSLRPQPVIDALNDYYQHFNSCGDRVKYKWGEILDQKVADARHQTLKYLKLSSKKYFVSFTLNTTYGLNLLLNQIDPKYFKQIYTSDIEHNSVFLSTMALAKNHQISRTVISRNDNGSLPIEKYDFKKALVVVNVVSNFDGQKLLNLKDLIKKVHKNDGIVIVDAAQGMIHARDLLKHTEADAICFSAHKLYAPSLGVMIVCRDLLEKIQTSFIGGGMVDDVREKDCDMSAEKNPDHIHTIFEPGLQAWGEIVAYGAALDWIEHLPKSAYTKLQAQAEKLYNFLASSPKVHLINQAPNTTTSCYIDDIDSHLLSAALGDEGIMTRSGYFCAHYYLDHVKHYPNLLRFSLGFHNRDSDIDKVIAALEKVSK